MFTLIVDGAIRIIHLGVTIPIMVGVGVSVGECILIIIIRILIGVGVMVPTMRTTPLIGAAIVGIVDTITVVLITIMAIMVGDTVVAAAMEWGAPAKQWEKIWEQDFPTVWFPHRQAEPIHQLRAVVV